MSDVLKRRKLTFFQRVALESLWFFCRAFAMTPYWFRYYVTENLIYVILYLMRYRMKVVQDQSAQLVSGEERAGAQHHPAQVLPHAGPRYSSIRSALRG